MTKKLKKLTSGSDPRDRSMNPDRIIAVVALVISILTAIGSGVGYFNQNGKWMALNAGRLVLDSITLGRPIKLRKSEYDRLPYRKAAYVDYSERPADPVMEVPFMLVVFDKETSEYDHGIFPFLDPKVGQAEIKRLHLDPRRFEIRKMFEWTLNFKNTGATPIHDVAITVDVQPVPGGPWSLGSPRVISELGSQRPISIETIATVPDLNALPSPIQNFKITTSYKTFNATPVRDTYFAEFNNTSGSWVKKATDTIVGGLQTMEVEHR